MRELLGEISELRKSEVAYLIDNRMGEFREKGEESSHEIFKELCFCILCANYNAERGIRIQEELGEDFLYLHRSKLARRLRQIGYRYPETRARYIAEARTYKDSLKEILGSFRTEIELREWLAKNVAGIGFKESSHFMRNIGYTDVSIIDFHILDILERYDLIVKPKTLTKTRYLEIENILRGVAGSAGLNLGELDLYLWYMETGKILK
jgi:N-glycosylase/DNA lyase